MNSSLEQAITIFREKGKDQKIQMINQILDLEMTSAEKTNIIDLTPFIAGCFVATPNNEMGTALVIRETRLFDRIPELKQKEKLKELFAKGRSEVYVEYGGEPRKVLVTFELNALLEVGNIFHQKVEASELDKKKTYDSAMNILNYLDSLGAVE